MRVDFFHINKEAPNLRSKGEHIASVELEIVPNGLFVIDGITYATRWVPTFHIVSTREGHVVESVEILVDRNGLYPVIIPT